MQNIQRMGHHSQVLSEEIGEEGYDIFEMTGRRSDHDRPD
jgi:hypothetical protein